MNPHPFVLNTVHNMGLIVKSASGIRFKDHQGREYIDLAGQANTLTCGYNNRKILESLRDRLKDWVNTTPYMLNQDQLDAAALLAKCLPRHLRFTSFYSNGSDAVETAIKLSFRATGRRKIVSHWGGYHGFSAYALAAGGATFYRQSYEPMIPGFVHIPPPHLGKDITKEGLVNNIKNAFFYEGNQTIAAVIVEPILSAGVVIPPPEYLKAIRTLCDECGAVLIFDEVITGFGKTGKMFAFEHFGVEPDILVMGKGISGSAIPAGAITVNERVMNMLGNMAGDLKEDLLFSDQHSGQHLISNQNHPLICTAVKATIQYIIDHGLVEHARKVGDYMLNRLVELEKKYVQLRRARGKGLLAGIEVVDPENPWKGNPDLASALCQKMFQKGVIMYSVFNRVPEMAIILFAPPLVITQEDIDTVLHLFEDSLKEIIHQK